MEGDMFVLFKDGNGAYRFKFVSEGVVILYSMPYNTKGYALKRIDTVKRIIATATIKDETE